MTHSPRSPIAAGAALFVLGGLTAQDPAAAPEPGFLVGMRGFESFHEPLGQPLYFESPFNESNVRGLFLHHEFSSGSAIGGGDLQVYAVQARLALTERLQFIATKDGYSDLNSGLIDDEGWNDIGFGLKWVAYSDPAEAASQVVQQAGIQRPGGPVGVHVGIVPRRGDTGPAEGVQQPAEPGAVRGRRGHRLVGVDSPGGHRRNRSRQPP